MTRPVFEDVLLAFSVSENLGKLSSHTPSDFGLDCVFGFKFYAMFMILAGHSLLFLVGGPVLQRDGNKQENSERLIAAVNLSPRRSMRRQSLAFNFSRRSVERLLHELKFHPARYVLFRNYLIADSVMDVQNRWITMCAHEPSSNATTIDSVVGPGKIEEDESQEKVVRSIANEPFKNNQLFVDTFFLVSGFLLSRLMLVELDKNKRINLFSFFALRYIRLTPAYAVVIAFYATLFVKIDSGPLWDARIGLERDRCVASWWANIIYVNNYVNTDMLCMFQSWYIAADTQLFLISMFLVYTMWRWPTVGKILLFVVLALSVAIPYVITLISRLDPLLMMFRTELEDISSNAFFKNSYVKTHMRGTPYFLGVLLGYLVHRLQQSDKKVPR
ncbi:unnamed protein product, partial [Timema podura]|nr:unnamed protein product [Timema podura]